jgi:ribonuclease HI
MESSASKPIHCFTDGSATKNGKPGAKAGWAIVFPDHPEWDDSQRLTESETQTNNRAEFTAAIRAIEKALETGTSHLIIHTDSTLLINSLTTWMPGWKKRNWHKSDGSPVLNQDLLKNLDTLVSRLRVEWKHVRAHTKKEDWESRWNAVADHRATSTVASS